MRALFYADYPHQLAGAAKSLLAAVSYARDQGLCDPVMVMPAAGLVMEACRERGIEAHVLEGSPAYHSFGRALLRLERRAQAGVIFKELLPYAVRFAREIDRLRADVVHFNTARGTLLAGLGAHLSGRASVLHLRGTARYERKYWLAAQAMSHRILLVARALEAELVPSAIARSTVVHDGIADRPIVPRDEARTLLVNARDVPADAFSRGPVFVSLSSLVPFKGLHHLARAVASLKGAARESTFLLAGTGNVGPYESWLRREVCALGVEGRVHFLGFVRDPHVLVCAADALVLPSVEREVLDVEGQRIEVDGNEGLPHSILEAMLVGIPTIASDLAGVNEQIDDGASGLLTIPGDVPALATAIERLAGDRAERVAMGTRARQMCRERFSIECAGRGLVEGLEAARGSASAVRTAANALTTALDTARLLTT